MPCALPMALRFAIIEQKAQGQSLRCISERLHLCYSTVRNIYRRYQRQGPDGLTPLYHRCGVVQPCARQQLFKRAALWLKRLHPGWGAPLICLQLKERYGTCYLRSERTLQRWFKTLGLYQPKTALPTVEGRWARQVHDVWQMDGKEQLRLSSGQKACYLSIVDEKSGSLLDAFVFPPLLFK
ncbi:MAG: helix-turn-helix domain-containing protein [Chitinophagaceae bacterium]|nr:MAG: helix-turn-helix domain-containing protein [Chitinophagaceae bacterium]